MVTGGSTLLNHVEVLIEVGQPEKYLTEFYPTFGQDPAGGGQ
jgi:hypothetical protein